MAAGSTVPHQEDMDRSPNLDLIVVSAIILAGATVVNAMDRGCIEQCRAEPTDTKEKREEDRLRAVG